MAINVSDPTPTRSSPTHSHSPQSPQTRSSPSARATAFASPSASTGADYIAPSTGLTQPKGSSSTGTSISISSRASLSSIRDSISDNPYIHSFSEIRSATNNFLSKKHSSSSTNCWRCILRGRDFIVFQRKYRWKLETQHLKERLSVICRSHHNSIIKLHGASIFNDYIYLVYEFIDGANLSDCLWNSKNSDFTVLSKWMSRIQIATDLAHGLDYIHNSIGLNVNLVHIHIKSSSIIVKEPSLNAKICHFGTAQLCGAWEEESDRRNGSDFGKETETSEIVEEEPVASLTRSSSRRMQCEGMRGYMAPEFRATGILSQKSDVYAFGVVILELLSGEEPFKYEFDETRGEFIRTSVIDTARMVTDGGDGGGGGGREGRLRTWMDRRRLGDSFPVDVAES